MRFYQISDLHIGGSLTFETAIDKFGKLCGKIRAEHPTREDVLFVFTGDIVEAGNPSSYDIAKRIFDFIKEELKEYIVVFELLPGNHDLVADNGAGENGNSESFSAFDRFIKNYQQQPRNYGDRSVYSAIYDNVNFIFADSNLARKHQEPGRLDTSVIKCKIKKEMQNILFLHHGILQTSCDGHDTIENEWQVITELKKAGINFVFHGHIHKSSTSRLKDELVIIGCGSMGKDTSDMPGIFNQFNIGYIRDGKVANVIRYVDVSDSTSGYAPEQLYPKSKTFEDPDTIGKIEYKKPLEYGISRTVFPHLIALKDPLKPALPSSEKITLLDAFNTEDRILLLSDAGQGKTTELEYLAYALYNTAYFPFLYSLGNYTGEGISELLPTDYRKLIAHRRFLIFDGYDELSNDEQKRFVKQLQTFVNENLETKILISARSNFCKSEANNESRTLPNFIIYDLCKLTDEDVRAYLVGKINDVPSFYEELRAKNLKELMYNPFFLMRVIGFFIKNNCLPPKANLMDCLLNDVFNIDDIKFSISLEDRYRELHTLLGQISLSMQLMQNYHLDNRQEYQDLFSTKDRELAKHSGILVKDGDGWRFVHNNFREYLTAKYLTRLPQEQVLDIISSGGGIKPSWVNTLGYLTGLKLDWDLMSWLEENTPNALVKCEPDRVDSQMRDKILRALFQTYEEKKLWFNDELCDEVELARFSCSVESLRFILDKIKNPVNYVSQHNALQILRHFPSLYHLSNEVREVLLVCCRLFPKTRKDICRLAMYSICQLKLFNECATQELYQLFGNSNIDYIRLGMYEYLIATEQQDEYVNFFLDGIQYIKYRINSNDNRIGNENFVLIEGLKKMLTSKSVYQVLEWFSVEDYTDFFGGEDIFSFICERATKLHNLGEKDFYNVIMHCFRNAASLGHNRAMTDIARFLETTNNVKRAAIECANEPAGQIWIFQELMHFTPQALAFISQAYQDDKLVNRKLFHKIVSKYVWDEELFDEYAKMILLKDKIELPNPKRVDYQAKRWREQQDYFDMLFDLQKVKTVLLELISRVGNPEITVGEIYELRYQSDMVFSAMRLLIIIKQYADSSSRAIDFFDHVVWRDVILLEAKKILQNNANISISKAQKQVLESLVKEKIQNDLFVNAVKYKSGNVSVPLMLVVVLFLIQHLDYQLNTVSLLHITELPTFCFDEKNTVTKYEFLQARLSPTALKERIIENINEEKVQCAILQDHFEFCKVHRIQCVAARALALCNDINTSSCLRRIALEYLYELFGWEYIANNVVQHVKGDFLIDIAELCKDVPKDKLKSAMEMQYKLHPTMELLGYLLKYNSRMALETYVKMVHEKRGIPEEAVINTGDPTEAIQSIHNIELLPLLGQLLDELLESDFKDRDFRSLRSSLLEALIKCGNENPEAVFATIELRRKKAEQTEEELRYINYILEEIERGRRRAFDTPFSLIQVKEILTMVSDK